MFSLFSRIPNIAHVRSELWVTPLSVFLLFFIWDGTSCQTINCLNLAMSLTGCRQQRGEWQSSKNAAVTIISPTPTLPSLAARNQK